MSGCNCKTEIEAKLTENFKANKPEASEHSVSLEGYGFCIVNNTLTMKPTMPYKARASYPMKAGGSKDKTLTGTMVFSFCPFCGVRLEAKQAEHPTQPSEHQHAIQL